MNKILYHQIENNLNSLFELECPPNKQSSSIMTNKMDILNEFKKWYDFWNSKRPHITDLSLVTNDKYAPLFIIKIHICDNRIVGICKELKRIGLLKEFEELYC